MQFDALTWAVLSFLLGTFLGHRLAIHRDKRKDFNDLADELFLVFNAQAGSPAPTRGPSGKSIALIRRRMWWLLRWRFDRALNDYKKAAAQDNQKQTSDGQPLYVDDERVKKAATKVCKFLHRK